LKKLSTRPAATHPDTTTIKTGKRDQDKFLQSKKFILISSCCQAVQQMQSLLFALPSFCVFLWW